MAHSGDRYEIAEVLPLLSVNGTDGNNACHLDPDLVQKSRWTRRRLWSLALVGHLAVMSETLAHTALPLLILPMKEQYDWSGGTVGLILAAYAMGYAPFQIPSGFLSSRFGGRRQVIVSMFAIAVVTVVTPASIGAVGSFGSGQIGKNGRVTIMMMTTILKGVFGSLLNPAMHQLIATTPAEYQTQTHNIVYSGQQSGCVIGVAISGVIAQHWGWVWGFHIYGIFSFIVGGMWWLLVTVPTEVMPVVVLSSDTGATVRNSMSDPKPDSSHETSCTAVMSLPWRGILTSPPFIVLVLNHFAWDYGSYTFVSFFPDWLHSVLNYDVQKSGFISMLAPLCAFVVVLGCGPVLTFVVTKDYCSLTTARKTAQGTGLLVPATLLLIVCFAIPWHGSSAIRECIVLLTVGRAVSAMCLSGHHINHIDLSPRYAPVLYGFSNTIANLSGIVSPAVRGYILGSTPTNSNWVTVFCISAAVQVAAATLYIIWGSGRKQSWG